MNIVLCGMMGAGKTTVGVKLSELTGKRWFDTDQMITDRYGKIADIFEYYGEEYFRRLETDIVKEIAQNDDAVISTGGGLVLFPENTDLLKKNGKIVFLRVNLKTLTERLQVDTARPLLLNNLERVDEKLEELLKERTPVYESVADYTVDADGNTPEQTAKSVLKIFKEISQ